MILISHFTKYCNKCKTIKMIDMFGNKKDVKQNMCKSCYSMYAKDNRDRIKLKRKLYRELNKEKIADTTRRYYDNNKEKISEYTKEYVKSDIWKSKKEQHDMQNKENIILKRKIYRSSDRGRISSNNSDHKRRAILKNSKVVLNELINLKNNAKVCYWCKCSLVGIKTHIDHYISLSKGGEHTLSNLVVSCNTCNLRKNAKDPLEFANSIGRLL